MRLWTMKTMATATALSAGEDVVPDPALASTSVFHELVRPWWFVISRLRMVTPPPASDAVPVWWWRRWRGESIPPDYRCAEFAHGYDDVIIESEVDDGDILLIDDDVFSLMVAGAPAWTASEWEEFERGQREDWGVVEAERTWSRVFDVDGDNVVALTWVMKSSEVVRMRPRGRRWVRTIPSRSRMTSS